MKTTQRKATYWSICGTKYGVGVWGPRLYVFGEMKAKAAAAAINLDNTAKRAQSKFFATNDRRYLELFHDIIAERDEKLATCGLTVSEILS